MVNEEIDAWIKRYNIKSPNGNELSEALPFNLMFKTTIGPTGKSVGYLRPETSQGILEYNNGKLPFACTTVGPAFRNEISPRMGLLRVREFTLAEIENFLDTTYKTHPKINQVLKLFGRNQQASGGYPETFTISQALDNGLILNETHAYHMARTYLFMVFILEIGMLSDGIRFRQHLRNEMSYYASDCWDCEILTSYGWVEVVDIADRACYDLTNHSKCSGQDMKAFIPYCTPKKEPTIQITPNKQILGTTFGSNYTKIIDFLNDMNREELNNLKNLMHVNNAIDVLIDNTTYKLTNDMIKFEHIAKITHGKFITHGVIEPSFGIGRILYCLLEHAYRVRTSNQNSLPRTVLSLSNIIAPYKIAIISTNDSFNNLLTNLLNRFIDLNTSCKSDTSSASIGKKYARLDELGVPYIITIENIHTCTIRERDSCTQIRIPLDQTTQIIQPLINNTKTWGEIFQEFPPINQ